MIRFDELQNLAADWQIPIETAEKDYCLTWLLIGLAQTPLRETFVFYGGTALKKMWFPDYRFSEDLDFMIRYPLDRPQLTARITEALQTASQNINITFDLDKDTTIFREDRWQGFITYSGYGEISAIKQIKIDILQEYDRAQPPLKRPVLSPYRDTRNMSAQLDVCTLETIFSDKLATLISPTRTEPRDVYDLWALSAGEKIDTKQIKENFKYTTGYYPDWPMIKSSLNNPLYAERWNIRLKHQIPDLPDYSTILIEITSRLKNMFNKL